MTTRTQLAYAAAGVVLILGLLSLFNPVFAGRLLGLEIASPRGLSEVRAAYGAMHVTMAALILWGLPLRPRAGGMVRVVGLLWLGAAAGRVASMTIDPGVTGLANLGLLLLQLAVGGALLWASYETPPTPAESRARRDVVAARKRVEGARARATRQSPAQPPVPAGDAEPPGAPADAPPRHGGA